MSYNAKRRYEVVKFATRTLRSELNKSLKTKGFDFKLRTRVGGYWNDGTIYMDVTVPSWFKHLDENDNWEPSEKSKKLISSFVTRILNIVTTEDLSSEVWGDELTKDDIKDRIVWEATIRGNGGSVRVGV